MLKWHNALLQVFYIKHKLSERNDAEKQITNQPNMRSGHFTVYI